MYLIFDTETNGKALNFKAPMTNLSNWPRITQIAWQLFDKDQNIISERSELIKPDGWTVPKEEFFIKNNMSTERCEEFGLPLAEVLKSFVEDLSKAEYLIAHNMNFDANVVGAEFIRLNMTPEKMPTKICTLQESTDYCKIPGFYGNYKWPTLTELHVKLFREEFEGAHDAMDDVRACAKCFFGLKEIGHILKG